MCCVIRHVANLWMLGDRLVWNNGRLSGSRMKPKEGKTLVRRHSVHDEPHMNSPGTERDAVW
jgi:hypothetical protein